MTVLESPVSGSVGRSFLFQHLIATFFLTGKGIVCGVVSGLKQMHLKPRKPLPKISAQGIEFGQAVAVLMTVPETGGVHHKMQMHMIRIQMNSVYHLIFTKVLSHLKSKL